MSKLSELYEALRPATDANGSPVLQKNYDALLGFARKIMECWPEGDADGGYIQECAIEFGLIALDTPTQEERDENGLSEWDDWYRKTELLVPNARGKRRNPRSGFASA